MNNLKMRDFWKENAIIIDMFYEDGLNTMVDYQEGYYICPDCKSKVYRNKSYDNVLETYFCPFCKGTKLICQGA